MPNELAWDKCATDQSDLVIHGPCFADGVAISGGPSLALLMADSW